MGSKRFGYLDIAKAIAIVFIILGHYIPWEGIGSEMPLIISDTGYSFHVILFFIVSGFFYNPQKPYQLKRELRSLIAPYLLTCLIIIFLGALYSLLVVGKDAALSSFLYWLGASFYGVGTPNLPTLWSAGCIGGLWFLLALFWGRLFLAYCNKLPHAPLWIIGLFIAGYALSPFVWLPFGIQNGMCTSLYLYIGQYIKRNKLFEDKSIPIPIWVILFAVWGAVIIYCGGFYPVINAYPHGILNFIGAICGTFCIVSISKGIENHLTPVSRFLQLIGRNTLVVFCMHIVELDIFPTMAVQSLIQTTTGIPMWIITLVLHFGLIALLSGIMYIMPKSISSIYFPQKRKPPIVESLEN